MELATAGLIVMAVSSIGGLALFGLTLRSAKGRDRAISADAITLHLGFAAVAIAVWFAYVAGGRELGGARGFTVVLLAVVLLAGLAELRAVLDARKVDPEGDKIAEATINPLHIFGHVAIGVVAIGLVVAAAVIG